MKRLRRQNDVFSEKWSNDATLLTNYRVIHLTTGVLATNVGKTLPAGLIWPYKAFKLDANDSMIQINRSYLFIVSLYALSYIYELPALLHLEFSELPSDKLLLE
jgi:hypothetical protein